MPGQNSAVYISDANLIHAISPSTMTMLQRLYNFQIKIDIDLVTDLDAAWTDA